MKPIKARSRSPAIVLSGIDRRDKAKVAVGATRGAAPVDADSPIARNHLSTFAACFLFSAVPDSGRLLPVNPANGSAFAVVAMRARKLRTDARLRNAADMLVEVAAVVPFVYTPMGVPQVGFTCRFGLGHVNGKSLVLCVG